MIEAVVVGLGWWGRHFVSVLEDSEKIRIRGLAARSPDKHRDFATQNDLPLYDSYEDVLADKSIDAVLLCTPHSQHETQVLAALEAGKQVFCEKPLALSRKSAERMVSAAGKRGLVLGIGHERRFEPALAEIASLAKSASFGTPMHVEANWSHDFLVGIDPESWRAAPEEGPSLSMTGMGMHLSDLMIAMFGPVEAVCATRSDRVLGLPTGDVVALQLRFANGATGFLGAIAATPYYCRFTLFGDQMWAEARDSGHPQHGGETFVTLCGKDGRQTTRSFPPYDAARANLEEWADAAQGRTNYRFTPEQLVNNVAVLEALGLSAERGEWVTV